MRFLPAFLFLIFAFHLPAQENANKEGEKKASKPVKVSGRVQVQHFWDSETTTDASKTNEGFRVRRGRIKIAAEPSEYVKAMIQLEARDNSPRMLDAEIDVKLNTWTLRAGQFKVPVWREELRSSGDLLLIERSIAAEFLAANLFSARHIGVELNGKIGASEVAVNVSNGAGEGGREDAGREKSNAFAANLHTNNGKMVSARFNLPIMKGVELGASGSVNQLGNSIDTVDNRGTAWAAGLDGATQVEVLGGQVIAEGGVMAGSFAKKILGSNKDRKFKGGDVSVLWRDKFSGPKSGLVGADGYELAAGVSYLEPNSLVDEDEEWNFRFGPAILFGPKMRLQLNGEWTVSTASGSKTEFGLRTQWTVNF